MNKLNFNHTANIKSPKGENKPRRDYFEHRTSIGIRTASKNLFDLCTQLLQTRMPSRITGADTFDIAIAEFYVALQGGKDRFVSLPKVAPSQGQINSNQSLSPLSVGGV